MLQLSKKSFWCDAQNNQPCEVAFNCMRQFLGITMLVKKRCFVCNKPGAPMCSCRKRTLPTLVISGTFLTDSDCVGLLAECACFCGDECAAAGREAHKKVCALVKASAVTVEEETLLLC